MLGFVTLPDDRFHTVTLAEDEYVAVLPAKHPLAGSPSTPTASLDGVPFIMMQEGAHRSIEPLLERAAVRPRVRYRFSQVISILGIVQQGLGVSIAPRLALPEQYPGVVYRPLEPRAPRRVALAMRDVAELSPVARVFVELADRWARRRRARGDTDGRTASGGSPGLAGIVVSCPAWRVRRRVIHQPSDRGEDT